MFKRLDGSLKRRFPQFFAAGGIDSNQIAELQHKVRQVTFEDTLYEYLLDIVAATRSCDELHVGVSTRGAICLPTTG